MTSVKEELLELRKEFEKFDKKDPAAIRKWFADHPYLNVNDHAMIAGKSCWYIRQLRKRGGIGGTCPGKIPGPTIRRRIVNIEVPEDWDNKEWLQQALLRYNQKQIAKAVGRHFTAINARIKKWNLITRPVQEIVKPQHPCFSRAWLYDHYITKRLSTKQCAILAGTCHQTITNWLGRLNIPLKQRGGVTDTPIWVRKMIFELERQPVVRTVRIRQNHVHIRLMHYFWESYYPNRTGRRLPLSYNITEDDARLRKVPEVSYQYESNLDGTNPHPGHIQINRRQWQQASFLERRMAMHTFGQRVFNNKYIQLTHPTKVLEYELEFMRNIDETRFIQGAGFTAFPLLAGIRHAPGKQIIEHFFDLRCLWDNILSSPRYITHVLNALASQNLPFDTHNMVRVLLTGPPTLGHKRVPRIPNPMVYAVMLRRLGVRGTVLDLQPGFGPRAIACAILGLRYVYRPNKLFQDAVNNGFADFIGLQCQEYDGSKVDMLLCDDDMALPDLSDVTAMAKSANNMLLFVPRKLRYKLQGNLPPKSIIPIRSRYYVREMDYFFVY